MDAIDAADLAMVRRILALPNARREVLEPLIDSMVVPGQLMAAAVPGPGRLAEVLMRMELAGADYLAVRTPGAPLLVLSDDHFPASVLTELVEEPVVITGEYAAGLVTCLIDRGATLQFSERWASRSHKCEPTGWIAFIRAEG